MHRTGKAVAMCNELMILRVDDTLIFIIHKGLHLVKYQIFNLQKNKKMPLKKVKLR